MAKVVCIVLFSEKENESGREQHFVTVTCGACGHAEESWGEGPRSVRRCLALLRDNCPEEQVNFYVTEGEHERD